MVGRSSTTSRKAMASIRNITVEDQGNNWRVGFEWNLDDQTGSWTQFETLFPRDFDDIDSDEAEQVFLDLAMAVARGRGVPL